MRVTVSHNKGLQGAMKLVNDSADQVIASAATGPVTITDITRRWEGPTMHFSFRGGFGAFNAPFKGYVQCAETEVTVEVELPAALKAFVPEEKMKTQLEGRVRGLLKG
jgi:hypothetical protein